MLKQFVRFGLVGALGTATNIGVFSLAIKYITLSPTIGSALGFMLASMQNFAINRIWTFSLRGRNRVRFFKSYLRYITINLVGFAANVAVLNLIINEIGYDYSIEGQLAGIISGMGFNFVLSKLFVFSRPRQSEMVATGKLP